MEDDQTAAQETQEIQENQADNQEIEDDQTAAQQIGSSTDDF